MADPVLIIRENCVGIDAWLVDRRGKSQSVQDLARVVYEDLEPTGEDQSPFDAGLAVVVQALDPAVQKNSTLQVMLLLPTDRFYFRSTRLPFTSRSKIRQVLPLELNARFPKELGPVVTDFFRYELHTQQSTPLIFSASIEEDILKSYHAGLTAAGLKPVAIVPGTPALAASFLQQNKENKNFVFLDMNGCRPTLVMVVQGEIVQVRTLAENPASLLPEQAIRQMLLGGRQRFGFTDPFDIYVCGDFDVSVQTEMQTRLADILKFQSDFMGQDAGEDKLSESVTESGFLALSELLAFMSPDLDMLNMCRGEYSSDSFIRTHLRYIASCCALALLSFILFMVNIHMDISRLEKQVDQQNQAMAAIYKKAFPNKRVGNIDPLLLMQAGVGELTRGGSANADAGDIDRVPAGSILVELSRCIPADVTVQVDRLMLDRTRMIVSGSADNYNTIDQVKGFIEKSPFFKQVNIGSAVAGKGGNLVDFKFIIEI